ncbi:hypothetical protein [Nostoc sp. WHI]|uniref:hypothetical protein n=1 Tax=Nostoc sp. WHI TaxID=2650611 RepID=UPI0018C69D45|nr:hypothetical protein [Nostoc sp. WHI]MBG1268705.1 hypothetical protein [Nostoc sp. WHI]
MKKIFFTQSTQQSQNFFDLCVGILVFIIVVLTFWLGNTKPIPGTGNTPPKTNLEPSTVAPYSKYNNELLN